MYENVNVCITPKGDKPVLHFSQFDNKNVFTVTVLADDGESAAVLTGLDIEFRLRKTDSHVVTIAPQSVADNVITFKTTEQLCACCGQNIASVVFMKDDMVISTLDILVDIQRDILSGGLTSESDIRNLTTQIEQIVPEVVGDDYYNKQEVDDLLSEHTFDPSKYYDKQEVDELIAEHTFDPSHYYDKSDVDDLLEDKADSDDVYNKTETDNLLADKADKSDTYTKTNVDNLLMGRMGNIEFTALTPGTYPAISFNSSYNAPLIDIEAEITSSTSNINLIRCGKNLFSDVWSDYTRPNDYRICPITLTPGQTYKLSATLKGTAMSGIVVGLVKDGTQYSTFVGFTQLITSTGSINTVESFIVDETFTNPKLVVYASNEAAFNSIFENYDVQLEKGSQATSFVPYNCQVKTITLGTTVSSGSIDFARGTITDSGNIIKFTPVILDAVVGENNVYIDVGDMTSLTYVSQADLGLMTLLEAYTLR